MEARSNSVELPIQRYAFRLSDGEEQQVNPCKDKKCEPKGQDEHAQIEMATTTLARLDRRPPDRLILRITPPLKAYHALSSVSDFAPQGKSGPLGSTTGWAATPRLKTLVRSHSGRAPGPLVEK